MKTSKVLMNALGFLLKAFQMEQLLAESNLYSVIPTQ